jgi:hypothetical protein
MTSEPKLSFEELVEREQSRYHNDPEGENGFRNGIEFTLDNLDKCESVKKLLDRIKIHTRDSVQITSGALKCSINNAIAEFERETNVTVPIAGWNYGE